MREPHRCRSGETQLDGWQHSTDCRAGDPLGRNGSSTSDRVPIVAAIAFVRSLSGCAPVSRIAFVLLRTNSGVSEDETRCRIELPDIATSEQPHFCEAAGR